MFFNPGFKSAGDDYSWKTTKGTGDFVFKEASKRRSHARRCAEIFEGWGYSEVITPTIEYFDSLAPGLDVGLEEELFRFFDRDGKLLALRPEMTTPIARVVGTRLRDHPLPLRCYYIADVYRNEPPQATHRRQFLQAGIELIGKRDLVADAEVVTVIIETLRGLGLEEFTVGIGHIDFLKGLFRSLNLDSRLEKGIREALRSKNLVTLERLLGESGLSSRECAAIRELPFLIGGEEVLDRSLGLAEGDASARAVDRLRKLYSLLASSDLEGYIRFDLGMIKDFDYYTGIILEAYTDSIGSSLCTGGRYDELTGYFGRELPAVGFALGLERVFLALERNSEGGRVPPDTPDDPPLRVYCTPESRSSILKVAGGIRERGFRAAIMDTVADEKDWPPATKHGRGYELLVAGERTRIRIMPPAALSGEGSGWLKLREFWKLLEEFE